MNVVTDTWRQLVRRRLWPVAVLLVGALAAVPMLLAKEPEPPVLPAPQETATAQRAVASAEPIVALATEEDRDRRRRVLGVRKNPFEPAPTPEPKPVETPDAPALPSIDTSMSPGGSTAPPSSSFTPPSSSPPSYSPPSYAPPVTEPTEPEEKHTLYELTVRFDGERRSLERLEALPDADNPVLVYLGPGEDGRSAVFMVDAGVTTEGDATCDPDPVTCETIELREGETQFLEVVAEEGTDTSGGEHQLDLIEIHREKTTDAKKAQKARAAESKGGRRALKARVALLGPLRYDYDRVTGTVQRLGDRAFEAKVAVAGGQIAAGL